MANNETGQPKKEASAHSELTPRSGPSKKSDSSNLKDSKKMDEIVPMELAQPQSVVEERRGVFKKLFMKIGERVGVVKTSEFSQEYLDAVKNADQYEELVSQLCTAIMSVCQPNPKLVPSALSTMEFEAPNEEDPFEKLSNYLPYLNANYPDKEAVAVSRVVASNMAQAHRILQKSARRSLHFMRTFLNVDCPIIDDERRTLIKYRQDMDYSRHEYTNNPSETKRLTFESSQQRFNDQMAKIFGLLNQIPQKKVEHSTELLTFLNNLQAYHETCFNECKKLRPYRAKFGPPTTLEEL